MSYNPSQKNAGWLDWALERIEDLPYKPTARWLFYRLVQEKGFVKADYKRFLQITSKARKGYYNGWTPETFADDTREIIGEFGIGFTSPFSWFDSQARKKPRLEIAWHQKNLVIVCFEAKAMVGQFKHLLGDMRVPLCPFGGDASIPFKYKIAELVDSCSDFYDEEDEKPIYILYFGDYDPKGLEIPENAMRDINAWSTLDFRYIRCGINKEHLERYDIPDRPEEPGKYQWEALDEDAAKEVIISSVGEYWDFDVATLVREAESRCGEVWSDAVQEAILQAKEKLGDLELEFPEGGDDEVEI